MKIYKFFHYAYLIFAVLFIIDAVQNWGRGSRTYISLGLAALAIFVFFFRRRFMKRYENKK